MLYGTSVQKIEASMQTYHDVELVDLTINPASATIHVLKIWSRSWNSKLKQANVTKSSLRLCFLP